MMLKRKREKKKQRRERAMIWERNEKTRNCERHSNIGKEEGR